MIATEDPLPNEDLRDNPPPFQYTFRTPLKDLKTFVAAIVSAGLVTEGKLSIDQVVFEPTNLIACLDHYSIGRDLLHLTLVASKAEEVRELLQAALADWLDFVFVAEEESLVIYADHDEYTTLFARSRGALDHIVMALKGSGFEPNDYQRAFLG